MKTSHPSDAPTSPPGQAREAIPSPEQLTPGVVPATAPVPIETLIEDIAHPVVALDLDARVMACNSAATRLFGLRPPRTPLPLFGDFAQCAHAATDKGCGRTDHCAACAIRNSVEYTARTGEPVVRAESVLRIRTADGDEFTTRLCFSTSRATSCVTVVFHSPPREDGDPPREDGDPPRH